MELKVLTYNIHKGLNTFGTNYTLHVIKENLIKTQANICFLQEVARKNDSTKYGNMQNQFEFLADSVWSYFSYGQNASYPKGDHGNAILSSFPIFYEKNLDISLNKFEKRGLLHVQISHANKSSPIHLINTHLNLRNNDRLKQVQDIHLYLETYIKNSEPIIFCGDFNDWNFKVHQYILNEMNFKESHLTLGKDLPKTYPSFFPLMCLDRVYYKNLDISSVELLNEKSWNKISDHLPILATFIY